MDTVVEKKRVGQCPFSCELCGGFGEVRTMERVYPGEPHMADVGTAPCPNLPKVERDEDY